MGILNVTPDSFSDAGLYQETEKAVAQGLSLVQEGADWVDIGGESTRPGSAPVSADEECRRVIPVIEGLTRLGKIRISIDTSKAFVAERALAVGASGVNDVSALRSDPGMADVVRRYNVPIVLMHMKGSPRDMQMGPHYDDVVAEVYHFFEERIAFSVQNGISRERILLDPGIGFGKTLQHNLVLLKNLSAFHPLGCPIVIGPSRKSFIGDILRLPVGERLEGTAAAVTAAILQGASVVRVHDVKAMVRVAQVADAIREGTWPVFGSES